jgi:serine/threonine protein kinase
MQRVNPHFYGKGIFKYNPGTLDNKDSILDKVKAGIRHLHCLGLVHNDINLTNIMFDKDDNPVIIDFDSCTPIGQTLKDVGRTY